MCSVPSKGEFFLSSFSYHGEASLMLPLSPEMANEEQKQNGLGPKVSTNEGQTSIFDHLKSLGFTEVNVERLLHAMLDEYILV